MRHVVHDDLLEGVDYQIQDRPAVQVVACGLRVKSDDAEAKEEYCEGGKTLCKQKRHVFINNMLCLL